MQVPLELSFHQIDHSDFAEQRVREKVDELHRFHNQIIACRVVIEAPHKSPHHTKHYRVRVDLTVPNKEFVADSAPTDDIKNMHDLYYAIDQAFDKIEKQMRRYHSKLTDVRPDHQPNEALTGVVARVFPNTVPDARDDGYGFVEAVDGREYFFRESALHGIDFDELEPGTRVKISERIEGSESPQPVAVNVTLQPTLFPEETDVPQGMHGESGTRGAKGHYHSD